MQPRYLYRGVSEAFHKANGGLLKPKTLGPFEYEFHWDEPGLTWDGGATWDSTAANAVIRHQWNQEGFPTSGISTTPHLERAVFYTRGRNGTSGGYVLKIDREVLQNLKVEELVVAEFCKPSVPEDDEVILVVGDLLHLPAAAIVEIIDVVAVTAL